MGGVARREEDRINKKCSTLAAVLASAGQPPPHLSPVVTSAPLSCSFSRPQKNSRQVGLAYGAINHGEGKNAAAR